VFWQAFVQALIFRGLEERWGRNDPSLNPDLQHIASSYLFGEMWVAILNGAVVGAGAVIPEVEQVGRVVRRSVLREMRSMGIGSKMLAHLESVGRQKGYTNMVLETT
jgi:ribosomal protein S18 acetylase RimI-like enzyme